MEKNHPKWEWKKNWEIIKHAVNFIHIHLIPLKKKKSSRDKLLKTVCREINLFFTENSHYLLQMI